MKKIELSFREFFALIEAGCITNKNELVEDFVKQIEARAWAQQF